MSKRGLEPGVGELIANIARTLADRPARVSVEVVADSLGSTLRLKVDADDIGNIIGEQRRTEKWL